MMRVGDYVLVTRGTTSAVDLGFIGKILLVTKIDRSECFLPFYVRDGDYKCWVSGVQVTDLLKALI